MTYEDVVKQSDAAALRTRAAHDLREPCGGSHGAHALVLTETYKEHVIAVQVSYHITVDGTGVETPLTIDSDGVIGSHALPQHAFRSPLHLVRALIDNFGGY